MTITRTSLTTLKKLCFSSIPPSLSQSKVNLKINITCAAVEKYPFEINQTGWGEFDIGVKIFFHDPAEKPVELTHGLKLYPEQNTQQQSTKKPVVSEHYDEIVFCEPTE